MKIVLIVIFCLFSFLGKSQSVQNVPFLLTSAEWVDSVYKSLSVDERIAQLIMVAAWSDKGADHVLETEQLIARYKIGGLAFFQGGPVRQAALVNRYQDLAKVPLLMAMDAEWGLGMRLDSTIRFPYQMALGAIRDDSLIYLMGREIGRQLKKTGMHMNFAPVLDINSNSSNPVINYRSFGSDKYNVSRKGIAYMKGLQDEGILATGKHFPGHGDTDLDSHYALPVIHHSISRLNDLELFPFRNAVRAGLSAMMVAHLNVPELDPDPLLPTTLSSKVITDLLEKQIGFDGLVVTDALNMKGVTDHFPPGEIEVRALEAGNDLLVYVQDVPLAIQSIRQALANGRLSEQSLEKSCKTVLAAKYWAVSHAPQRLNLENLTDEVNTASANWLNSQLTMASLTVLQNHADLIPVKNLDKVRIATVSVGKDAPSFFQKRIDNYTQTQSFYLPKTAGADEFKSLLNQLKDFDLVILGLHDLDMRPQKNFGLLPEVISFTGNLMAQNLTILTVFGNPYALDKIKGLKNAGGIVLAYQENWMTQNFAAQMIFGGIGATGRLPVDIGKKYRAGEGMDTKGGIRFSYVSPEAVGINGSALKKKIDSIAFSGLQANAYPGCVIFAAKDGKVFFQESYGYYDYSQTQKVDEKAIYDLASVTKITGPLLPLMKMVEDGIIHPDDPISKFWPAFRSTDKAWLTFREALSHQGGLQAWIPFYKDVQKDNQDFRWFTIKPDSSVRYPDRISDSLWLHRNYSKQLFNAIEESPLRTKREYVYSCLSFYLYPTILEQLTGRLYEDLLYEDYYQPLGAWTLVYNAWKYFPLDRLVPTENDDFFRHQQLRGYVHDEGAAMLAGISGNAGLFATAEDLAKLHQMYLWEGSYGGRSFLKKETIDLFNQYQYPEEGSRRGLGFDKPLVNNSDLEQDKAYPCKSASNESFGHSGYTGTLVWADPSNGLLFVFLSNRVYPTRNNTKLFDMNIRSNILETLYQNVN